uniref:Palmitoyltransferase n=1 Tax=Arcella intermedia TaxID=1963864 RepID=A0A6B2L6I9_9EUKA
MWFLSIYFLLSFLGIYVLLLGDIQFHRNGIVGRLNRYLRSGLVSDIQKIVDSCPGPIKSTLQCYIACFTSRHPLFLGMYIALVLGGYIIFLLRGLHHIPGPILGESHRIIPHLYITATFCWFIYVIRSDPGTIRSDNLKVHLERYPYDNILYRPRFCKICQIPRPARSRHCNSCKRCVSRFDHHCPWINGDIGADNQWKFVVFLMNTGCLCMYCFMVCFGILWGYILDQGYWHTGFVKPDGTVIQMGILLIIQFMARFDPWLFLLMCFTFVVSLVVFSFSLLQFSQALRNKTAVEVLKMNTLKNYIASKSNSVSIAELFSFIDTQSSPPDPEDKAQLDQYEKQYIYVFKQTEPVTKQNLLNIYDNGIHSNFIELFTSTTPFQSKNKLS